MRSASLCGDRHGLLGGWNRFLFERHRELVRGVAVFLVAEPNQVHGVAQVRPCPLIILIATNTRPHPGGRERITGARRWLDLRSHDRAARGVRQARRRASTQLRRRRRPRVPGPFKTLAMVGVLFALVFMSPTSAPPSSCSRRRQASFGHPRSGLGTWYSRGSWDWSPSRDDDARALPVSGSPRS